MSRARLHQLFQLPDPEQDPSPDPSLELINAAIRYRVATGGVDSAFFEAQSLKERVALERAGQRWLAPSIEQAAEPGPTPVEVPLDPHWIDRRENAQRLLLLALRDQVEFSDMPQSELSELLVYTVSWAKLRDAVAEEQLTPAEAAHRLMPALRPVVSLARDRANALREGRKQPSDRRLARLREVLAAREAAQAGASR